MNSLMLEVSESHRPIIVWVTFLEALRRGSLLGVSISPHSDTAIPCFLITQSVSPLRAGAQRPVIHSLRYLLSPYNISGAYRTTVNR